MAWLENVSTMQEFPSAITQEIRKHGWDLYIKYRIKRESTTKKATYADVKLFKSVGSDKQTRYFGMVHGYGGEKINNLINEDIVSHHSPLGKLEPVKGKSDTYVLKIFPVLPESFVLFKNGTEVKNTDSTIRYTLYTDTGEVVFNKSIDGNVPTDEDVITATFIPSPIAPKPPKRMGFFTFDDVRMEKFVIPSMDKTDEETEAMTMPEEGDGSNRVFTIQTLNNIKSLTVFVAGQEKEEDEHYTYDAKNKKITFKVPDTPLLGQEVRVQYVRDVTGTEDENVINLGDIPAARNFNPENVESMMGAVYTSLNYLRPSLPSSISFTDLDKMDRSWQRDTGIYYWGNINKDRIAMFFRLDPSAGPEHAYFTPLYIGRLRTTKKSPQRNMVIIAGTRTKDDITWNKDKKMGHFYVDYGPETSNGNSSVQLLQSYGGAFYQKHYFSFITHDYEVDHGEGRFNPSVYTGKYHISPFYVVHPNDGYVGTLDDVYAVHPKNISQIDELEIDYKDTLYEEEIGTSDGVRDVFHLSHTPSYKTETDPNDPKEFLQFEVYVGCTKKELGVDYDFDVETKAVVFKAGKIPLENKPILAKYKFKQLYRFTMPDTEISPFKGMNEGSKGGVSPYPNIGLAIMKDTKDLS